MCATTGLRHGGHSTGVDGQPFAPLDDREVSAEISAWWAASDGVMKITGRRARNLNPLVVPESGERALRFAWWWIWPSSSGPAKFSAFNARADKLTGKAWASPFQRRAIIPASWYLEKGVRFSHPSDHTFGIAAITSTVQETEDDELLTYAMVTRDAVGQAANTWHRMPLVLPPTRFDAWLDPDNAGTAEFARTAVEWSESISQEMTPEADPNRLF